MSKRLIDLFFSIIALIAITPICLCIAFFIWISSTGPIFYTSLRVGKNGVLFKFYKFRTMYPDAERRLQDLLDSSQTLSSEFATFKKLRNDPRITPIGKFLRKTSLDELPQFFNVLKGDMSLVGPRPYLPSEIASHPQKEIILSISPGLTGLWQVSGRNTISFEGRVALDVLYVQSMSLQNDLYILFKTPFALLKGAY